MKILKSSTISSFGGLNYVIDEAIGLKINNLINSSLPELPKQSKYSWFDILMSYWSVFFCGGNCAEDLSINLKDRFKDNPFINLPSPDRILSRVKSLAEKSLFFSTKRGQHKHEFSLAEGVNELNLRMLSLLPGFKKKDVTLDYDNTLIFAEKADAKRTYKKENGYYPGVGIIGKPPNCSKYPHPLLSFKSECNGDLDAKLFKSLTYLATTTLTNPFCSE